jgi:hypothetical protein
MIRRENEPWHGTLTWTLIDQADHARLAAQIARQWGAPPLLPLDPEDLLVETIARHDDGWRDWDAEPKLDSRRGRPIQFDEMSVADTDRIWTQSIEAIADLGPLAQYLVAGHFVALRSASSAADTEEGSRFIDRFHSRCEAWLSQWQQLAPRTNTANAARRALRQLQIFDAMSLWLCLGRPLHAVQFEAPGGNVEFVPTDGQLRLQPWPLRGQSLRIHVAGRRVPVKSYQDFAELAGAVIEQAELSWTLCPAEPS